ncbi:MAG: class I SAM-dependent methyltransferase, partial [Pseudobdellovibrionaceae bacterium]
MDKNQTTYIHGFSEEEQRRLQKQARFGEHAIYKNIDFSDCEQVLEVGCGVGAQSEILLRRFPSLNLTCIDLNPDQLSACQKYLSELPFAQGRYRIQQMSASH